MTGTASAGGGGIPRLVLATQNRGKAEELERFFRGVLRVESLADYPGIEMPEETGLRFIENAKAKAEHVVSLLGLPALGDDSGLEVDALGGGPGVHSARYAPGTDVDRYEKLLRALEGVEPSARTARFVCALAFAAPGREPALTEGEVRGRIASHARGRGGFGYDPVFLPEAAPGRTMAELSAEEKQAISHRGRALIQIRPVVLGYFSLAGEGALP